MIYDCFPFYNELDILELRLTELYDFVDHFVLVEADTTYTSRPKPFYYEDNQDRYAQWADKIIHIKVTDMPNHPDAWVNDIFQRNQIARGIADASPDDLIMVSDCDEIIRPEAIKYMRDSDQSLFALRMTLHNFKFNYMKLNPDRYSVWAMAGRRSLFDDIEPDAFRQLRFQFFNQPYQFSNDGCEVVEHGGWHFGYMGDKDWLLDKAQSFAHTEVNTPEFLAQIDPAASIAARTEWNLDSTAEYEIVELDDYFPKTVVNNPERYSKYILANPVAKAIDLLPKYPYNS
jgi:beta-1,4-mannosyl-glycoprotein beta-1,4-N-acetylglucosaminyltransferase